MKEKNILREILKYQQGGFQPPRVGQRTSLDLGGFQATSRPIFDGIQVQPSSVNIQPFLQGVQTIQSQDRLNLFANQQLLREKKDIRDFNANIAKSMLNVSSKSTSNQTKLDLTSKWQADLHAKIVAAQSDFKNSLAGMIGSGNTQINPAEIMAAKKPLDDLLNSNEYKTALQVNGFRDDLLKSVATQRGNKDVVINGDAMKEKLGLIQRYAQNPQDPSIDLADVFDTSDLFYNSKNVADMINKGIEKYETSSQTDLARIDPDNPGLVQSLTKVNPLDVEEYSKVMASDFWNRPGVKAWAESLGYDNMEAFRKGILEPSLQLRREGLGSVGADGTRDDITGINPLARNLVLSPDGKSLVSSLDPSVRQAELDHAAALERMETDENIREKTAIGEIEKDVYEFQQNSKKFAPHRSTISGVGVSAGAQFKKDFPGAALVWESAGAMDILMTPDEAVKIASGLEDGLGLTAGNIEQIFEVADKFNTQDPELTNKEIIEKTREFLEGNAPGPDGTTIGRNIPDPFGEGDWALQTIQNVYDRTRRARVARTQAIQASNSPTKVTLTGDPNKDRAEYVRAIESGRDEYGDSYHITEKGNSTTALGPYQFTYSIHKKRIGEHLDDRGVNWSSIDLSEDMVGKEGGLTQKEFNYLRDNNVWGSEKRMKANSLTEDDKKKAIAFLRREDVQESVWREHSPEIERWAKDLRKVKGSERFTDIELEYLVHHHGLKDARHFISTGESPVVDGDRDVTKEINDALSKLRAVQVNSGAGPLPGLGESTAEEAEDFNFTGYNLEGATPTGPVGEVVAEPVGGDVLGASEPFAPDPDLSAAVREGAIVTPPVNPNIADTIQSEIQQDIIAQENRQPQRRNPAEIIDGEPSPRPIDTSGIERSNTAEAIVSNNFNPELFDNPTLQTPRGTATNPAYIERQLNEQLTEIPKGETDVKNLGADVKVTKLESPNIVVINIDGKPSAMFDGDTENIEEKVKDWISENLPK